MSELDLETFRLIFEKALEPYYERAKKWWDDEAAAFVPTVSGTFELNNAPNGLRIRFTATASHSAVKGIQAFPFITTRYLNIPRVPGGYVQAIDALMNDDTYKYKTHTIVHKRYLAGLAFQAQSLCFIPTRLFDVLRGNTRWVLITESMAHELMTGHIPLTLINKIEKYYIYK